ncbi:MAG: hypothetical protein QOF54_306 [Solirubrobacteraceae bacterium]|jgi:hypothetical protein|nr:hypothetical protein [Solirubrobacteraceae bacterium]
MNPTTTPTGQFSHQTFASTRAGGMRTVPA